MICVLRLLPDPLFLISSSLSGILLGFLLCKLFLFIQVPEPGDPRVGVVGVVHQFPDPLHLLLLSLVSLDPVVLLDPSALLAIGTLESLSWLKL